MRITNKIMQNNSLYNINQNKVMEDKLTTQMATGKKITRPSDDPVVAIRALRLRSDVSQLDQFYEKNAPDAEAWLKVTEDALATTSDVLTDLYKQAEKGSNEDVTPDDLRIIVTQMKNLSDEFYSTGNVDFAGRYVFTGYRTDTPLNFTKDETLQYSITETFDPSALDTREHTTLGKLNGLTTDNYSGKTTVENDIENKEYHRLRLAYENIDKPATGADPLKLTITKADGSTEDIDVTIISKETDPFASVDGSGAVLIPETGELLFSDSVYESKLKDLDADASLSLTYDKSDWKKGDLKPEHYFTCTTTETVDGKEVKTKYNQKTGDENPIDQIIEYDVGYNQKIRVNTQGWEVFTPEVRRNVQDLDNALVELENIDTIIKNLDTIKKSITEDDPNYSKVQDEIDSANKAYTYIRNNMQEMFEKAITQMQKALDDTSVAITDNGTRSSRLDLIANRLMSQTTTFEDLQSDNEDVDITEVAIMLKSSELTYEASLQATSKIMQTNLMNYI